MKLLFAVLVLLAAWACAGESRAQSCTATIPDINFGTNIDTLGGAAPNASTLVSVSCTGLENRPHTVCLSLGTGVDGLSGGARAMDRDGTRNPVVRYQLYTNSNRSTVADGPRLGYDAGGDVLTIPIPTGGGPRTASRALYGTYGAGQQTAQPGAYFSSFNTTAHTELGLLPSGVTDCANALRAGTVTRPTFVVRATLRSDCQMSVAPLNFGSRGLLGGAVNAASTVALTCTNSTPFSLALNGGNANAAPTARRMSRGGEFITYGLYRDTGRTQPWGSAAGTTAAGTGSGLSQTLTVYGQTPAQRTPSPGVYTDVVVATATF